MFSSIFLPPSSKELGGFFLEAALALPRVVSLGQVGVPQMLYLFRRTREADATAGRGKPRP